MEHVSRAEVTGKLLDACEAVELESYIGLCFVSTLVINAVYPSLILPAVGFLSLLLGFARPFRLEPSDSEMDILIMNVWNSPTTTINPYKATIRSYALSLML